MSEIENELNDYVQRFVFDDLDARGCIVGLNESISEIQQTHYYPPNLAKLLNEFVAAAVLLRDSIKVDADITIQLRNSKDSAEKAISLLMADCMSDRRVRAIAEYENELLPSTSQLSLHSLTKGSVLTITITPKEGERYQSIVPLEHNTLAECLEDYFTRSEQLPTWFILLANESQAVAIALHALPAEKLQDKDESQEAFLRLKMLTNTLKQDEAFELQSQSILTRLFHQESCRIFNANEVQFGCVCTVEKSLNAIKSLGKEQVNELIAEQAEQGKEGLFVDCHFCFQRYEFSESQIDKLFIHEVN